MKTKVIELVSTIVILIGYIGRVSYVYNHSVKAKSVYYSIGEEVEIGDDYFDTSQERMKGYSVTMLDYEVVSIEEFKERYPDYHNERKAEYMCMIKARFRNIDNNYGNAAGIDLGQYILQNRAYINFIDRDAYPLINGFDSLKFALRVNTEKEMILPYHIDSLYISASKLKNGDSQLVVSLYPNKKIISFS